MDTRRRNCYRSRLERLVSFIELDAPAPIIAHAALLVADIALPKTPGRKNLIRHLVDFERASMDYSIALDDPNSEESKEYREIEKMMDDIDIDEMRWIERA